MKIAITIIFIVVTLLILSRDTVIYLIQCCKYKYLAARGFYRHL